MTANRTRSTRSLRGRGYCSLSIAAAIAAALAGCAQGLETLELAKTGDNLETSSIATSAASDAPGAHPPKSAIAAVIAQARKIRLDGDKARALQVLDAASEKHADDKDLMKERGLVALEAGKIKQAETLLRKAFDSTAPDWRLHSGLGSALAAQGKQPEAQIQFAKALELAPDHPSVLNNLALSYALDGKHDEAEKLLKRVTKINGAQPKAQQNLALLVGLKGNVAEARKLSTSVLPPDAARGNLSYLEGLRSGGERAIVSRADPSAEPMTASKTAE